MNTYYDEDGKLLGRAWSTMPCTNARTEPTDHSPHSWNGQFTIYGPYMCGGFPEIPIYDSKPRKPVNER